MPDLIKFFAALQVKEPKLKIAFKDQSLLMKILAAIMFFNPNFSKQFITVIGQTIYYPSQAYYESLNPIDIQMHVSHEYRHMRDATKNPLFYFLYLCPQILAPLWLLLGIWSWVAAIAMFVIFLLPWPAPFRAFYEFRGYESDLFVLNEIMLSKNMDQFLRKEILLNNVELIKPQFTSFNYYLMWIFGKEKKLKQSVDKIISGEIIREDVTLEELRVAVAQSHV